MRDESVDIHADNPCATDPSSPAAAACDECGRPYERRTRWQRFCGEHCRNVYHNRNRRGVPPDTKTGSETWQRHCQARLRRKKVNL